MTSWPRERGAILFRLSFALGSRSGNGCVCVQADSSPSSSRRVVVIFLDLLRRRGAGGLERRHRTHSLSSARAPVHSNSVGTHAAFPSVGGTAAAVQFRAGGRRATVQYFKTRAPCQVPARPLPGPQPAVYPKFNSSLAVKTAKSRLTQRVPSCAHRTAHRMALAVRLRRNVLFAECM